jgi:anti-anti-sigma factor
MVVSHDETTGALKLGGALEIGAADLLRDCLRDYFQRQPKYLLDLSEVNSCDAAALQLLLAARQTAARSGRSFRLSGISTAVGETAAALGVSIEEPASSACAGDTQGRTDGAI